MATKQQLTKAETQVMNVLWSLPDEKGYSSEIMERMPEPKPAMTTLLTFLKILTWIIHKGTKKETFFFAMLAKTSTFKCLKNKVIKTLQ